MLATNDNMQLYNIAMAVEQHKKDKTKWWDRFLIHPNSRMKITWDLIVIVLSVYNSLIIPYDFAYTVEESVYFVAIDYIIDSFFILDIFISFRTIYQDKTDDDVLDGKKIAINYIMYGRFPVDVIASMPLDVFILFLNTSSSTLNFLGMLKMVRLLRLGRMISFLKKSQGLKFSMKFLQLIFFLTLYIHWINWAWVYVVETKETWFPSKDLDEKITIAYSGNPFQRYIIFYYYGTLTVTGSEILPTTTIELLAATLIVFIGAVVFGLTIGEFSSILSAMTARDRAKNDEVDILSSTMLLLRLPEDIQSRVLEYHDELVKADFVKEQSFYDLLSPHLGNSIKLFSIKKTLKSLSFMNIKNIREVESFASKCDIKFYLAGEVILKQGGENDKFYFVWSGLAEAFIENKDFIFFDYKAVEEFISHTISKEELEEEERRLEEEDRKRKEKDAENFENANIRIERGEIKTLADLLPNLLKNK